MAKTALPNVYPDVGVLAVLLSYHTLVLQPILFLILFQTGVLALLLPLDTQVSPKAGSVALLQPLLLPKTPPIVPSSQTHFSGAGIYREEYEGGPPVSPMERRGVRGHLAQEPP